VVKAADVGTERTSAGASVRILLDARSEGQGLVRRLVDVPPGSWFDGAAGAAGELWYVIGGSGRLEADGHAAQPLSTDHGLWFPPGSVYRLHADDAAELRLDVVTLPATVDADGPTAEGLSSRGLGDCEVETTGDRKFRVLFGPGRGCSTATQFVGEIPPGRAPAHSHPYDELVLILHGEGTAHIGGADHALSAGTCLHLPPGLLHCLENSGPEIMRVLGVFHPADSPAAKLEQHG
jgi:quercetin dioxygenase-like cupin family protein